MRSTTKFVIDFTRMVKTQVFRLKAEVGGHHHGFGTNKVDLIDEAKMTVLVLLFCYNPEI